MNSKRQLEMGDDEEGLVGALENHPLVKAVGNLFGGVASLRVDGSCSANEKSASAQEVGAMAICHAGERTLDGG